MIGNELPWRNSSPIPYLMKKRGLRFKGSAKEVFRYGEEGVLMTKIEIVNKVAEETGLTKVKAEEAVETIFSLIKEILSQGESVILRRFGSFQVRSKNARVGRNPKTGEEAAIPARRVVRFKSGKHFKEAVNIPG